jgi:hypothetical protein
MCIKICCFLLLIDYPSVFLICEVSLPRSFVFVFSITHFKVFNVVCTKNTKNFGLGKNLYYLQVKH